MSNIYNNFLCCASVYVSNRFLIHTSNIALSSEEIVSESIKYFLYQAKLIFFSLIFALIIFLKKFIAKSRKNILIAFTTPFHYDNHYLESIYSQYLQ